MSEITLTRFESNAYRMQRAMRQMLLEQTHSHWVTLNFHDDYDAGVARLKLRLWALNVMSRLFDKAMFAGVRRDDLFRFTALPEFTVCGHPHFHLLLWVDERCGPYFERIAGRLWKAVVPTGSSDIQRVEQTEQDYKQVVEYGTKLSHLPWQASNFIEGGMLDLPEVIRPLATACANMTTLRHAA